MLRRYLGIPTAAASLGAKDRFGSKSTQKHLKLMNYRKQIVFTVFTVLRSTILYQSLWCFCSCFAPANPANQLCIFFPLSPRAGILSGQNTTSLRNEVHPPQWLNGDNVLREFYCPGCQHLCRITIYSPPSPPFGANL